MIITILQDFKPAISFYFKYDQLIQHTQLLTIIVITLRLRVSIFLQVCENRTHDF